MSIYNEPFDFKNLSIILFIQNKHKMYPLNKRYGPARIARRIIEFDIDPLFNWVDISVIKSASTKNITLSWLNSLSQSSVALEKLLSINF